jgi:hypothetical protein
MVEGRRGSYEGNDGGAREALRQALLGEVFGGVAVDDVADLVPQHAGHLVFGFELLQQGRRDEYLSAGQRKRVDGLRVGQHVKVEFIRGIAPGGALQHFVAHPVYVILELLVGVQAAVLLGHLRGGLQAQGNFLFHRHVHPLLFAGDGVFLRSETICNQGYECNPNGYDNLIIPPCLFSFQKSNGTSGFERE